MQQKTPSQFAICVDNSEYPVALELHKVYRVLPDEEAALDGDLRIIDESGEDYLYPADIRHNLTKLCLSGHQNGDKWATKRGRFRARDGFRSLICSESQENSPLESQKWP